jgi:nitrile hydratase
MKSEQTRTHPRTNGAHDLGGAADLGPVPVEPLGPVANERWEDVVFTLMLGGAMGGVFGVEQHRTAMEGMNPTLYMACSYFERWLVAIETCLIHAGVTTAEDIEERVDAVASHPDRELPRGANQELTAAIRSILDDGFQGEGWPDRKPVYAVGDKVRAKVIRVEPGRGHTRSPGYVHGHFGVVEEVYPPQPLGEAIVAGEEKSEFVYRVGFRSADLWPDADPLDRVKTDLFESYMEPADPSRSATTSGEEQR